MRRTERKWDTGKKQTSREKAKRVFGGLPSEGNQRVTATVLRNDADDQVVLHELRSGCDLEVPVSAEAGPHRHAQPGHRLFLHGLSDHQHLTSRRVAGGQFYVTIKCDAARSKGLGVSQRAGKVIVTASGNIHSCAPVSHRPPRRSRHRDTGAMIRTCGCEISG